MKDLASLHLDNHDSRLKYYHLFMTMPAKTEIPHYDLPAGYSFTTYTPGDRDTWIEIEKSAKEFSTFEEGVDAWQRYYGKHEDVLPDRMFFIVDPNGKKVATATAFFDEKLPGGWLHWVSVSRDAQGKGLSRPLIAHTLHRLQALGYKELFVPTQTTTWVAAKLYLDFGFRPVPENFKENHFGWRMLKTLTDHPALKELEPVEVDELLNK